ncbi:MAG: HAD family hydrolase [Candidatus Thorarchaeota archaeon]
MIKGVVFDIDGTLLNHEQALERALTNFYSLMKKSIPHSRFNEFFLTWKENTVKYINEYLSGRLSFQQQRILRVQSVFNKWEYPLTSDKAMELFKIYLNEYENNWSLYEDVVPCLTRLQHFPLGVISDGDGEQQRKKLAFTGIDSYFRSIIISGEVGLQKPHPKLFRKSANELNLSLDEILYIGDQLEKDALGAHSAGMQGVLINRTNQIHVCSKIKIITKLTEVLQLVDQQK